MVFIFIFTLFLNSSLSFHSKSYEKKTNKSVKKVDICYYWISMGEKETFILDSRYKKKLLESERELKKHWLNKPQMSFEHDHSDRVKWTSVTKRKRIRKKNEKKKSSSTYKICSLQFICKSIWGISHWKNCKNNNNSICKKPIKKSNKFKNKKKYVKASRNATNFQIIAHYLIVVCDWRMLLEFQLKSYSFEIQSLLLQFLCDFFLFFFFYFWNQLSNLIEHTYTHWWVWHSK